MAFWLMKSEPSEFSILDLQRLGHARWDGVRNYQARNFYAMQPGDLFFFYHSSCPQPNVHPYLVDHTALFILFCPQRAVIF